MSSTNAMDAEFIRKLRKIVLENLEVEHFSGEDLARASGTSRSHVYRRLKASLGLPVSHFIRAIRLQQAMEMLQHSEDTVSEIAYKVGFSSPAYFNRCFHDLFGLPPGEVRKKLKTGEVNAREVENPDKVFGDILEIPGKIRLSGKQSYTRLIWGVVLFAILAVTVFFAYVRIGSLSSGHSQLRSKVLSIMVLPLKNLGGDGDFQYFADGIMEEIQSCLSRISQLKVISRTTSEYFSRSGLTSREIARKVNVGYILEGSIRYDGNRARINVQLTGSSGNHQLWSETYDRELTSILGVQSEIALAVANQLKTVLFATDIDRIIKLPTRSDTAYDHYLRGRFLLHKANSEQRFDISREGLTASLQYFEKAIAADPDFSLAYAGLANAWFNLAAWGWLSDYYGGIESARKYCEKALEIDPQCAEARVIRGGILVWPERKFEQGRSEFVTAISLNPNYAYAHQAYAQLLMITGPMEMARVHIDIALELEPYFWVIQNLHAWICYFEGNHRKALEACRMARDLKPDYFINNWLFFINYCKLNEGVNALEELRGMVIQSSGTRQMVDELNTAFQISGIPGLFRWLVDLNRNSPLPAPGLNGHPYYIAWWYAILGDRENTIYWLERNLEHSNKLYVYFNLIITNPDFSFLKDDPRFQKVLDEIGLLKYLRHKAA